MWLLQRDILKQLENASIAGFKLSAKQQEDFEARIGYESGSAENNRILTIAGKVAQIDIRGVLTKNPSFIAMFFGGGNTTYGEIIDAFQIANNDEEIESITMVVDSGGGQVSGLFETIEVIQASTKPITTIVSGVAASAAYAIAAQADTFIAKSKGDMVGSIGVALEARIDENTVTLTSTKAPKKRPDLKTKEGQAMVIEELDAIHTLFVDVIADGRGVSVEKVNAEFGQGGMFLANEALKRGMIDQVGRLAPVNNTLSQTANIGGDNLEAETMTLEELKAKYPQLVKAVHDEGVEAGVQKERDRVLSHLDLAEGSGATDIAIEAIKANEEVTSRHMTKHLKATMTNGFLNGQQQDEKETAAAADNVNDDPEVADPKKEAQETADAVCEAFGISKTKA